MTAVAETMPVLGRRSPAEEEVLLAAAVAAPSVHNTQPWLFRMGPGHIDLLADPTRQLTAQDPDGRALTISCGAALLNLRVAAEYLGYLPKVELLPDPADASLLARLALNGRQERAGMAGELYEAIDRRHTNRMPYEDRPVPGPVLDALVEAARQEGAELHTVSDARERARMVALMHDADTDHEADADLIAEARHWTGVGPDRPDGVPADALGPLPSDPTTLHRDLARGQPVSGRHFAVFERDPTLAVLTTGRDDLRAWLVAGQALERVLLVATVEGLVATFANQAIEEPKLRWLLRDPDSAIGFPQMVMRLGYAAPAPAAPRRPLHEVVIR